MMKFSFERRSNLLFFGVLCAVALTSLSGPATSAQFNEILASDGATTVVDNSSGDGNTKLAVTFNGDASASGNPEGVWLSMTASTAADELIAIRMVNNTGTTIDELWLEIIKPDGQSLGAKPASEGWARGISDSTGNRFDTGWITAHTPVSEEDSSQRLHFTFDPPMSSDSGTTMLINPKFLDESGFFNGFFWKDLNLGGGDWWLNIDWNEEDNNKPGGGTPAEPVPHVTANSTDGPLTLQSGENVTIDLTFDARDSAGTDADWWAVASTTRFGWFQYSHPTGWVSIGTNLDLNTVQPAHQGKLGNVISPLRIFSASNLPKDSYKVYFGIDKNMNGKVDQDTLIFDTVQFTIQ